MAKTLFKFTSRPGVRRDGTELDSPYHADGEWVRWQRGLPRKMGGYRAISQIVNGPVRSMFIDSRNGVNSIHYFSQWGIQRQEFDINGSGSTVVDRTPIGFTPDQYLTWSQGAMFSSTGGTYSALLAASSPDLLDPTSDVPGYVYQGDLSNATPMQLVEDGSGPIQVSGGCCVLQPFLFVYGSNGLIRNSKENDFTPSGWSGGNSNAANVAGTKVMFGAPLRGGGQSPAGLFWALDSLIRVSFVGGTQLWAYDTISNPMSIMSKKCVIEHDGKFFWPGVDRFLFYNGVVQELPNNMNQNWFFDNLNYAHRNKVWGTKIARWGELWWFYPRGTDTECGDAVIYNYREDTWYDAVKVRSAGGPANIFQYPMWAGGEDFKLTQLLQTGVQLETSSGTVAPAVALNFAATTGVANGMLVSGPAGVAYGSEVASFTGTTVDLDTATTADVATGELVNFGTMHTPFQLNERVLGGTSSAYGYVARQTETTLNLYDVVGTFQLGETVTGDSGATAEVLEAPVAQTLVTAYQQEYRYDKIIGQGITAIPSSFTSRNFGIAVGAPFEDVPKTIDQMTRITRVEPDFNQSGDLTFTVEGRSFATQAMETLAAEVFGADAAFFEVRAQQRILRMKVKSNTIGGFYEQGHVLVTLEAGAERSTKATS